MKIYREALTIALTFALGVIIGVAIEEKMASKAYKEFLPPLATLFAAFLGATYAFSLNRQKEEGTVRDENLAAANRAIFAMARQTNKLVLVQRQVIDPHRSSPARAIEMPPMEGVGTEKINIDIDSLSFLLQTKYADMLAKVAVADSKFSAAIDSLQHRSRVHFHEAQPRIEAARLDGPTQTLGALKDALGERIYVTLARSTDQTIDLVDGSRAYIEEVAGQFRDTLKLIFPGSKFIAFSVPNQDADSKPA